MIDHSQLSDDELLALTQAHQKRHASIVSELVETLRAMVPAFRSGQLSVTNRETNMLLNAIETIAEDNDSYALRAALKACREGGMRMV